VVNSPAGRRNFARWAGPTILISTCRSLPSGRNYDDQRAIDIRAMRLPSKHPVRLIVSPWYKILRLRFERTWRFPQLSNCGCLPGKAGGSPVSTSQHDSGYKAGKLLKQFAVQHWICGEDRTGSEARSRSIQICKRATCLLNDYRECCDIENINV